MLLPFHLYLITEKKHNILNQQHCLNLNALPDFIVNVVGSFLMILVAKTSVWFLNSLYFAIVDISPAILEILSRTLSAIFYIY